jgi:hypothetical protein
MNESTLSGLVNFLCHYGAPNAENVSSFFGVSKNHWTYRRKKLYTEMIKNAKAEHSANEK